MREVYIAKVLEVCFACATAAQSQLLSFAEFLLRAPPKKGASNVLHEKGGDIK